MPIGAIIGAGASLFGASQQSDAISQAAKLQSGASNNALLLQLGAYKDANTNLEPYRGLGGAALNSLGQYFGLLPGGGGEFRDSIGSQVGPPPSPNDYPMLGGSSLGPPPGAPPSIKDYPVLGGSSLSAAPNPNDPNLRNQFLASPGYQYQVDESNRAIQDSASGKTGAVSGNMLKALQTNANGLASQDWNNFYNQNTQSWANNNSNYYNAFNALNTTYGNEQNAWANGQQNYWNYYNALSQNYGQRYSDASSNRSQLIAALSGMAAGGQNAATNQGGYGFAAAAGAGNALQSGAAAQGAGIIGGSNAMARAFNTLPSQLAPLYTSPTGGNSGGGGFASSPLGQGWNWLTGGGQPSSGGGFNPAAATGVDPNMYNAALGYGTSY